MSTPYDAPYKLIQRQPPFNMAYVGAGGEYKQARCVTVSAKRDSFGRVVGRTVRVNGECLVRGITKVRGKAAVKRAKRSRMRALKSVA